MLTSVPLALPVPPSRRNTMHFSTVGTFGQRLIDRFFQRQRLAAPPADVGRDLQLGLRVAVAIGDRLGRKAAKNHRVNRADPRAGQHRDRQLGHHRHVDRNAIARLNAKLLQHIGELANFAMQLA